MLLFNCTTYQWKCLNPALSPTIFQNLCIIPIAGFPLRIIFWRSCDTWQDRSTFMHLYASISSKHTLLGSYPSVVYHKPSPASSPAPQIAVPRLATMYFSTVLLGAIAPSASVIAECQLWVGGLQMHAVP